LNRTNIGFDIFLRERQSVEDLNNIADKVMNKLKFENSQTISYTTGSDHIFLSLTNKNNLSEKIKEIDKIQEIGYFILWTNPQQEISDSIADHDYFKAFALCSTTYDYLGKGILIKHINKNKLPINEKKIQGLQLDDVINKLYDFKLIDESLRSDMKKVNKIRHSFIHSILSRTIGKEQLQEIYKNIEKINTSLDILQKIYSI